MLYDIRLRIQYEYQTPTIGSRHVLHVLPAALEVQHPLVRLLELDPKPEEQSERVDFFGNPVVDIAYRAAHASFSLQLTARVERRGVRGERACALPLAALADDVAAVRSLAPDAPHHYMGESPRIELHTMFRAYARGQIANLDLNVLQAVETLGRALHRDMVFDPGSTQVDTPATQAFESRRGVCQDFSHIMIACLRSLGIPAAYVSGFLRTAPPPGEPPLEGVDAMHAWVRAWCGRDTGWVEFDPTNAVHVGEQHIAVARGRDYSDVAPVRGVVRIAGPQVSRQAVDVVPVNVKP